MPHNLEEMKPLIRVLIICILYFACISPAHASPSIAKVNVQSYGAKGDGITCDAAAIQRAINVLPAKGGIVVFPQPTVYYRIGPSKFIVINSNTHLRGIGDRPLIFNDSRSENPWIAHPVLFCNGNIAKHKVNITIENLTIRNGDAEVGNTVRDRGGIRADYVDRLTIKNCSIIKVQGNYGIDLRACSRVLLKGNYFHKCSYAAIEVLNECKDMKVEANIFDTALANPSGNSYLFGQGHMAEWPADFQAYNVEIFDNEFINNPQWSGITFHGGSNVHIGSNHFVNTSKACDIGNVPDNIADKEMANFSIEGNNIDISDEFKERPAIVVTGTIFANEYYPIKNVDILNNNVHGGNLGIYAYLADGIRIKNNNITNSYMAGIFLHYMVQHAKIDANLITDIRCLNIGDTYGASFGMYLNNGVYDCTISNNTIRFTEQDMHLATQYGIALGSEYEPRVHVQLSNNTIKAWFSKYIYEKYAPVEKVESPEGVLARSGDIALGPDDTPAYICDNPFPDVVLGSSKISTGILVSGHEGDSFVEIVSGDYWRMPSYCGITIEGAGIGGSDLSTTVTGVTLGRIYLQDALSTGVTSGRVLYRDAIWRKLTN